MQTPPLHEDMRVRSARSSSQRSATVTRPQGASALPQGASASLIVSQEREALEVALELIEMRYQEHCARMELETLFAEGGMGCL
jgi:hypothetical protein